MSSFSKFEDEKIVIFDGYCNFCSRGVDFLLKRDHKKTFLFVASQTENGKALLSHFAILQVDSVLYLRKGKVLKSSTAVLYILNDLGYPWKILFSFSIVPSFLRDALYHLFAKIRYTVFGKRSVCRVPTENDRERFI